MSRPSSASRPAPVESSEVGVAAGRVTLVGDLVLPRGSQGLVVFAHGSGSGRRSPRNRFVAGQLQAAGLGTLLLDLLTPEEEQMDARVGHLRFDIGLLGRRLVSTMDWLGRQGSTVGLPIGLFGASTGAAAALVAAAIRPSLIGAIVCRGGRPDLAGDALSVVEAPTLLIVGEADGQVRRMNDEALERLRCPSDLRVIPGAGHLFEEPGALGEVATLATAWFGQHLGARAEGHDMRRAGNVDGHRDSLG